MDEGLKSPPPEPLGLNRTLLFLLVVGLFIVAWQRNRVPESSSPAATTAPASSVKPTVATLTNSATDRNLVSVGETIHK